ncbi:hypothetical protein [Erwinia billingiae]
MFYLSNLLLHVIGFG